MAIFGSSRTEPGSQDWRDAESAGNRIAGAGLAVVTGGYGGTMEAASRGAARAGGRVIGVIASELFSTRNGANQHVTDLIETKTLAERIGVLTELAHGTIVLPGSIGTAAELVISWNINHIVRLSGGRRVPTVAVGPEWLQLWEFLTNRVGASGADVHHEASATDAVEWLLEQPEIRCFSSPVI